MSWKKIYAIYVTEVLLYLLLHAAQIRKGLFSPAVFTGILAVLFSMGGCLSAAFSGKKDSKKGGVGSGGKSFFCSFKVYIPYGWDMSF